MTIETYVPLRNGSIPNWMRPLIIYRNILRTGPVEMENLLRLMEWPPDRHSAFGMHPRHHFHSDTHELIAVTRGKLVGRYGGDGGTMAMLASEDVVVIPAGAGHFGEEIIESLRLIGAFPLGFAIHDFRLGDPREYSRMVARSCTIPAFDPLYDADGPFNKNMG